VPARTAALRLDADGGNARRNFIFLDNITRYLHQDFLSRSLVDSTYRKTPTRRGFVQPFAMRKGISVTVTPADRVRLDAIVLDRNSPQKHVWRARIVLLTADGKGTNAITKAAGKDKTAVWRWQERFMREGIQGLTRDKTRPSRIAPLPAETVDRVVALTNQVPPHEATH